MKKRFSEEQIIHILKEAEALGDLVLNEILSVPARKTSGNFGIRIGFKNLHSHLQTIHEARAYYVAQNPHEVEEIKELVESTAAVRQKIRQVFSRSQGRELQPLPAEPCRAPHKFLCAAPESYSGALSNCSLKQNVRDIG